MGGLWQFMLADLAFYWPGIILMVILLITLCADCSNCCCSTRSMILTTAILGMIGAVGYPAYVAIDVSSKHRQANQAVLGITFGFVRIGTPYGSGWDIFCSFTLKNAAFYITIGIYIMQIILACSLSKNVIVVRRKRRSGIYIV